MTGAGRLAGCRTWPSLAAAALALAVSAAHADQDTATGNGGTRTATVDLDFQVNIYKFVLLRVGAADGTSTSVDFRVGITPDLAVGNSQAYSGAIPGLTTRASTTNPASAAGAVTVEMFSNVAGTQITCSLAALAGATAFAVGGTSAAGVPGRNNILVTATGVNHPGANLGSCTGAVPAAVTSLSTLTGTYTYSTNYTPGALAAGTYGNVVTYTLTAP
ncbi:MAG: hypothetical protein K0R58_3838 [Ramlibacter sp.]|nr:hypothetical protein [Ramlibacter sp.]